MTPDTETVAEPSAALVREWTACALVRAATRFLPVPFLDDAVALRATRVAVSRTLRAHGRTYPATAIEPLYAERGQGLLRRITAVPRKLLLFPVRKWTRVAGAVTGVPTDVSRILLVGRATHRRLALGHLSTTDHRELALEAARLRDAFEAVVDEMDLRLLGGAVSDALGHVKDLTDAVVGYARERFGSDDAERAAEAGVDADPAKPAPVATGADQVQEALERPEVVRLLAEFDRRMDQRLRAS
ncbi:hypothetical protein [Jannaschia sp. R86511]|uniref:hypothetical protein n=1 Tax=Jannaschia sp. R86511 TaxID=3093853 RepID=UPI0036D212B1